MDKELTRREIECVRLAGQRLSDKEIAQHLDISPKTVQNHLASAFQKLGAAGRHDAARLLGELHPLSPIPIPASPAAMPVGPVAGSDPIRNRDDQRPPGRSLFDLYAGLGEWRTPPRSMGGRIGLIILIAAGVLLLLGSAMALLMIVFEAVEILRRS